MLNRPSNCIAKHLSDNVSENSRIRNRIHGLKNTATNLNNLGRERKRKNEKQELGRRKRRRQREIEK